MTWIGLTDFETPVLRKSNAPLAAPVLDAASILIEGKTPARGALPLELARLSLEAGRTLRLTLNPGGQILVETLSKAPQTLARVETDLTSPGLEFRIILNWPGEILVETGAGRRPFVASVPGLALPDEASLRKFIVQTPPARAHLSCYAAARSPQPIGPFACIAEGTPIDTAEGPKPIEQISAGDQVVTHDNGLQPVIWVGWREMPSCTFHRPIALRAPFFGLEQDVIVSACHRLMMGGPTVEYLFGVETVLIQAGDLTFGGGAVSVTSQKVVRFFHLLFSRPELISIAGTLGESLNLSNHRHLPEILESTMLKGLSAADLPAHRGTARPLKEGVEAAALMRERV